MADALIVYVRPVYFSVGNVLSFDGRQDGTLFGIGCWF